MRFTWIVILAIVLCLAVVLWTMSRDGGHLTQDQRFDSVEERALVRDQFAVHREPTLPATVQGVDASPPVPTPFEGVLVRVLASVNDQPIPGAAVLVLDGDRSVCSRCITDIRGEGLVTWPEVGEPIEFIARADGFADRHFQTSNQPTQLIELRLEEGQTLRGRVVLYDGRTPSFPVRVFAWSSVDPPSPRDFDLADRGETNILSCTTSDEGVFALPGIAIGTRYTVAAGAPGWSVRELTSEAESFSFVELRLERLFGLVLKAKREDGSELPHSRFWSCSYNEPEEFASEVSFPSTQASCAGVRVLAGVPRVGTDWRTLHALYLAPQEAGQIGPAACSYTVPGFESIKVEFDLPATEGDKVAERIVNFTPTPLGLGTLRIRFDGPLELGSAASGLWLSPHQLLLESLSAAAPSHEVGFTDPSRGVVEFSALPAGPYRLSVLIAGARAFPRDWPEHVIQVGEDPVEVQVPVAHHGAVWLRSSSFDAEQRGAMLEVHATLAGRNYKSRYVFQRGPYVLSGLHAGSYELEISAHQRDGKKQVVKLANVKVESGKMIEHSFDW